MVFSWTATTIQRSQAEKDDLALVEPSRFCAELIVSYWIIGSWEMSSKTPRFGMKKIEKASVSQIYGFDSFMNVNLHNAECMILCILVQQNQSIDCRNWLTNTSSFGHSLARIGNKTFNPNLCLSTQHMTPVSKSSSAGSCGRSNHPTGTSNASVLWTARCCVSSETASGSRVDGFIWLQWLPAATFWSFWGSRRRVKFSVLWSEFQNHQTADDTSSVLDGHFRSAKAAAELRISTSTSPREVAELPKDMGLVWLRTPIKMENHQVHYCLMAMLGIPHFCCAQNVQNAVLPTPIFGWVT